MNYRDPNAAFASAIAQGLDPDMFMYMYSTEERDYFKHVETREYVNFPKAEESDRISLVCAEAHREVLETGENRWVTVDHEGTLRIVNALPRPGDAVAYLKSTRRWGWSLWMGFDADGCRQYVSRVSE